MYERLNLEPIRYFYLLYFSNKNPIIIGPYAMAKIIHNSKYIAINKGVNAIENINKMKNFSKSTIAKLNIIINIKKRPCINL